jgi:hypothetical protein
MSELVRFRVARAPQRRVPRPADLVELEPSELVDAWLAAENLSGQVAGFLADLGITAQTNRLALPEGDDSGPALGQLRRLDRELTRRDNRPTVPELVEVLRRIYDREAAGVIADPAWPALRTRLGEILVAAVVGAVSPALRADVNRLLLVLALVELLAEKPVPLRTAEDVHHALRWRTILLPVALLRRLHAARPVLARRPGFTDLYVVRDEWNRYEAGEIAHIENVLPGEHKKRRHERVDETEQVTTSDRERTETNERDSQTTERFDLHDASTGDVSIAAHVDGKLDTSGQYGPTHVDTHLGASLDYSQEQADQRATDQSRETVSRAVTRVEERVREIRTTRTLSRITETNEHALTNASTKDPVVGVYRWVDKVQRVQVFRYPHRYLLEFQVPQPAAWWRWLIAGKSNRGLLTSEPTALTVDGTAGGRALTASDVTAATYLELGARYSTLGLTPPPENRVVAVALKRDSPDDPGTLKDSKDKEAIRFAIDTTLAVPVGYQATSWTAFVHSWHNYRFANGGGSIRMSVGSGDGAVASDSSGGSFDKPLSGTVGSVSTGTVPVAIMSDAVYGWSIDVLVTCAPLPETVTAWSIAAYEKIAASFFALQRQHREELAARAVAGGIEGSSPARNLEVVRTEVKRLVVEMLTGSRFTGRPAIDPAQPKAVPPTGPHVQLGTSATVATEIQFLEQAFEWENLSYVLYPYFWAGEADWPDLADQDGPDAAFDRFLRAGSARVVLPARPRFAEQVQTYVELGALWGGGPVPAPDDEDYLSVADEIKAQQLAPDDGEKGEAWEVRLPTTLVWLENKAGLPVKAKPELDAPPGHRLPVTPATPIPPAVTTAQPVGA